MTEQDFRKELEGLRAELQDLREQIRQLAAAAAPVTSAPVATAPPPPKEATPKGIDEDTLMLISAAVAAYLGKRARIRLVRPIPPTVDGWRLQGRVHIQGSHNPR